MTQARVTTDRRDGWDLVRMANDHLEAAIVPGLGGAIISLRVMSFDVELLWSTPWGLRPATAVSVGGDAEASAMEAYPGGWQTVFPNAGDATIVNGVQWPVHGEAWTAPFTWTEEQGTILMSARLVRSPFRLVKEVSLRDNVITVRERATNEGSEAVEAMWGQHPAFGPPFLDDSLRISIGGRSVALLTADREDAGLSSWCDWPLGRTIADMPCDLSSIPGVDRPESRMNYISDAPGLVQMINPRLGLSVEMEWDRAAWPYLWYWMESGGRRGFPWYGAARVLALEPASSWPGWGVGRVRALNGTTLTFDAGETKSAWVSVRAA